MCCSRSKTYGIRTSSIYLRENQGRRGKQELQQETCGHRWDPTQLWWNLCGHQPIPMSLVPNHKQNHCWLCLCHYCYWGTYQEFCTSNLVAGHHWRWSPMCSVSQISMLMTPRTHAAFGRSPRTLHTLLLLHLLWAQAWSSLFLLLLLLHIPEPVFSPHLPWFLQSKDHEIGGFDWWIVTMLTSFILLFRLL